MIDERHESPNEAELTEALARGFTRVLRLVRFSDPGEWLEELARQRGRLLMPWVRFTGLYRTDSQFPVIQHVFAAGGFWTPEEYVELRVHCGERMSGEHKEPLERYRRIREQVEAFCVAQGVGIRGGYYPGETKGG